MLAHIPTWVFFLFAGLLALGVWLGRPRAVSPRLQIVVAIGFLGYSIWGVISAFGGSPISLLLWAVGVGSPGDLHLWAIPVCGPGQPDSSHRGKSVGAVQ